MKRLILMRHAKSDWSAGPGSDHDRPLNARGRRAAAALGDWLRENDLTPDQVLCSTAMRTRETCVRLDLPETVMTSFEKSLYLASAGAILKTLQTATGNCVLMIGHNPGIAEMAEHVLNAPHDDPDFVRYPTGATLVADFDIEGWSDAGWRQANARHFLVPRAL